MTRARPGAQRLRQAVRRLRPAARASSPNPPPPPLKPEPCNAFEVAVAEKLDRLECEIDRLNSRFWWLATILIGAAVANVVLQLLQ